MKLVNLKVLQSVHILILAYILNFYSTKSCNLANICTIHDLEMDFILQIREVKMNENY